MFQQSAASDDVAQPAQNEPKGPSDPRTAPRDPFLEHYFKRIDPRLAASFTPDQCAAIKTMFGARGVAKHAVELRRSIPIGKRRYYLVLLMGRERRAFGRLFSEGAITGAFNVLGYAITAALWLVPAVAAAFLLQAFL